LLKQGTTSIKWLGEAVVLAMLVIIFCLSASLAYAYEDFSNARINSPNDIWDLVNDGEISYEYGQTLLELYDNPLLLTHASKEDLKELSILSQEEIKKLLEYQKDPAIEGDTHFSVVALKREMDTDVFEAIKPFLNQQQGQDNSLRLTYSSYQQGQTSELLKMSINPKTQLSLWNKNTQKDSLSKYCLEFYDCAVGYYFLRFGEGLVLNNSSRQSGDGVFHDTLWKKSKVMRGAYLTKPFNKIQSGIFFSDISAQPYTLSLKGFDKERLVGCHTKWQTRQLSVGYTGYASKLEGATTTTYFVMGPFVSIDLPAFHISSESAWYHATNTNGYGWIIRLEKSKPFYDIACSVYDFDKNFCTPYGHISGIGKTQDTVGGSVCISRFFKGKLSTVRASYDYSKGNNDRLKIMACYNPLKRIRTKWWMEAKDEKIAHTGKILWNITPDLSSMVGLKHEKNDGRDSGYTILESTHNLWHATNIKARVKWQNNMVGKNYTEYSLQLVNQLLKKHIRFIGKYTVKEYKDHTHDCRTNLEIKTVW